MILFLWLYISNIVLYMLNLITPFRYPFFIDSVLIYPRNTLHHVTIYDHIRICKYIVTRVYRK